MLSQFYYVVRSPASGEYLVAHPSSNGAEGYLLLFSADYDALSYINTHGSSLGCVVEQIPATALASTLKRWQLQGVGLVKDPLVPNIQFLCFENPLS